MDSNFIQRKQEEGQQGYGSQSLNSHANIKVVGVGGGGGNAVNRMIAAGLAGVDFWAMNTDAQVLQMSGAPNRIQLGSKLTNGLGAGGDPSKGEKAAEEKGKDIPADLECMKYLTEVEKDCWPCICYVAEKKDWKIKGCSSQLTQ